MTHRTRFFLAAIIICSPSTLFGCDAAGHAIVKKTAGSDSVPLRTVSPRVLASGGIKFTRFTGANSVSRTSAEASVLHWYRQERVLEAVVADVSDSQVGLVDKPCWVFSMGPQHRISIPNGDQTQPQYANFQVSYVDAHTGRLVVSELYGGAPNGY